MYTYVYAYIHIHIHTHTYIYFGNLSGVVKWIQASRKAAQCRRATCLIHWLNAVEQGDSTEHTHHSE